MKNKIYVLLIIFVFALAFFLRFYKLDSVPNGLEQDETSIGYNAYSISETGKDEYGESFPLYFKAFGEYKLPVYIYLSVVPIKIFGLNEFAVRCPSAFFGFLTVVVFCFLIKNIFEKNKKLISFFAAFLLAINPWHLHFSRGAFEVSVALFFITLGVLLAVISSKKHNFVLLSLSLTAFVISIYTYNIARLFSPLFVIFLLYWYRKEFLIKPISKIAFTFLIPFIFLMPFLFNFFSNGGLPSTEGTLIFSSSSVKAPLIEFRSYFAAEQTLITKIFFNILFLTIWQYLNNILSYFSAAFLFISGTSHGNHGIGNMGEFYLFEFPLILLGIYFFIKEKSRWMYIFLIWIVLTIAVASLTREAPYATRSFFIIIPFEAFCVFGLLCLYNLLNKTKYRAICLLVALFFVIYNLFYYFNSYYLRFPILYAKAWRSEDKSITGYIKDNYNQYDKIIFDKSSGFIYTSLIFYLKYPPVDFQQNIRESDDEEGFSIVKSFGKFEFKNVDWNKDYNKNQRVLIITATQNKPQEVPALKVFYYPKRPIVFAVKNKIIQYPTEEAAYVLVKSK